MEKQPSATTVVNASFNLGFQIRGHNPEKLTLGIDAEKLAGK